MINIKYLLKILLRYISKKILFIKYLILKKINRTKINIFKFFIKYITSYIINIYNIKKVYRFFF